MWALAHVADCLTDGDVAGAREHLGLLMVAMEQSSLDEGRWELAWLLTLLEDPPPSLCHNRGVGANPHSRVIAPRWTTTALPYLKEV